MLLCLLDCRPRKVIGDHGAQDGDGVDPPHAVAVYVEWSWICPVLPEVQDDFFGLCGVQRQAVC